jgi:hypothetical protein
LSVARLALALLLSLHAGAAADEDQARLMLELEAPTPGSVIGDPQGLAFVAGKALALYGEYQTFDIVFVIDTSRSTAEPSGSDIDEDGKIGRRGGSFVEDYLAWLPFLRWLPLPNSDRGDSILAAELQAVRTLVDQLDPRTTRVGIVSFAGDQDPMTLDADTEAPLTAEFDEVDDALDNIMRDGP